MVPPPCDQMNRMSGKRAAVPVNSTEPIARDVSVWNSTTARCTSGRSPRQQSATVGWV